MIAQNIYEQVDELRIDVCIPVLNDPAHPELVKLSIELEAASVWKQRPACTEETSCSCADEEISFVLNKMDRLDDGEHFEVVVNMDNVDSAAAFLWSHPDFGLTWTLAKQLADMTRAEGINLGADAL